MPVNTEKRQRTKQKLADALIALCEEKNYYDITIWDICSKADLYRSTFYRYYDTKDDMLREIEHEYLEKTRDLTRSLGDFTPDAPPEQMQLFLSELTADMEYHRRNSRLCRFLLSPAGDLYFHQKMIRSIEAAVRENYRKFGHRSGSDTDYQINFFAAGFIQTISSWLEKNDREPGEIAAFILDMMIRLSSLSA